MAARFDWETIRAEYEAGASQSDLSRRHGISRKAIQKHIQAEGWSQDVSGTVGRMAVARVAGIVAGCDPKKKAQALDRAASKAADEILKIRDLWDKQHGLALESVEARDFETAKLSKILAEMITLRQNGIFKAYGILESDTRPAAAVRSEQDAIRNGIREAFASVGRGKD